MPKHDNPSLVRVKVINPCIVFLVGTLGINVQGTWVVTTRDRKTGRAQATPVSLFVYQGARHLVSLRGESEWVRNLRVCGEAKLRRGRTVQKFLVAEEVPDERKTQVLRAYLQRWDVQMKRHLKLDRLASDEQLAESAPNVPVFRLIPTV